MSYKTVDKELAPSSISDKAVDGELPLSDIRVIDFGAGGIDPITCQYLADFGAEVIKVESNSKLDFVREIGPFVDGERNPDRCIGFVRYNQNKLSALINLKQPKGIELAKKLVSIADVVTQNFSLGVFERLGLGYEELRKVKPDIIMLSSSFGGETGPYRHFRAHGNLVATIAGLDEVTGWPDRPPDSRGAFSDHWLPYTWVIAIIAALEHRQRTGKGQFIDASSVEGTVDVLDTAITDYAVNGRILKRRGNRNPAAAPYGVYCCQGDDRWCAITVFTDQEWQSFCRVLGNPAWTTEERFSTLLGRLENVDDLDQLVGEWTREQRAEELMSRLQEAGVAASVVKNGKDLCEDPQLIHRGHFWEPNELELEGFTFEAPPAILNKTPARFQRSAPLVGEHNDYVFCDLLGLDAEEYAKLVEEKVIY